jgi:hypothetical protein
MIQHLLFMLVASCTRWLGWVWLRAAVLLRLLPVSCSKLPIIGC